MWGTTCDLPRARAQTEWMPTPVRVDTSLGLTETESRSLTWLICWVVYVFRGSRERLNLPAREECSRFSLRLAHSRLLTLLLDGLKSMWFTSPAPSCGLPRNARATSWCTYTPLRILRGEDEGSTRLRRGYPLLSVLRAITLPSLMPPPLRWVSRLRTRPSLLTSYRPSKPTAGFQTSLSISHLSAGVCSIFSDAARSYFWVFKNCPMAFRISSARETSCLLASDWRLSSIGAGM